MRQHFFLLLVVLLAEQGLYVVIIIHITWKFNINSAIHACICTVHLLVHSAIREFVFFNIQTLSKFLKQIFISCLKGRPQGTNNCRTGWKFFQESCYHFGSQKATWPEAEVHVLSKQNKWGSAPPTTRKFGHYIHKVILQKHLP